MLGPAVAWNLTGSPAVTKLLTIDGLSVLKQPSTASGYGVAVESIELTEMAPGQVSSLQFTLTDPNGALTFQAGAVVRYVDVTRDLPLFTGFIESTDIRALGIGRELVISCVGLEILLDWMQVDAFTISATAADAAVQDVVSHAIGVGYPLNYAAGATCTVATPVSPGSFALGVFPIAIPAGSLRQALEALRPAMQLGFGPLSRDRWWFTVDFRGGLRFARQSSTTWNVSDYAGTIAINGLGFARVPADTHYSIDGSGVTRQVKVVGGNAAGTAVISDGSGVPGPTAIINDANSLTADYARTVAAAYFGSNGIALSGTTRTEENIDAGAVGAEVRAGCGVTILDASVGQFTPGFSTIVSLVNQIDKIYWPSDKETWVIHFGGMVTGSQYIRRLTRAVLNN